jgi:hypothetical protein
VQDGAAHDRLHGRVRPWQHVERALQHPICPERRRKCGEEAPRGGDRLGVRVDGMDVEPVRQEIWKVASGAASGFEHTPPGVETTAHELIEEVDVDVAEPGAKVIGNRGVRHAAAILSLMLGSARDSMSRGFSTLAGAIAGFFVGGWIGLGAAHGLYDCCYGESMLPTLGSAVGLPAGAILAWFGWSRRSPTL